MKGLGGSYHKVIYVREAGKPRPRSEGPRSQLRGRHVRVMVIIAHVHCHPDSEYSVVSPQQSNRALLTYSSPWTS